MTSHVARLYASAVALVVFFVSWAAIAAHPWVAAKPDPRVAALAAREQRLHVQSVHLKRVLDRRWAAYRVALAARNRAIAARKVQIAARERLIAQRQAQAAALASAPVASAPATYSPAPAAAAPVRVVTLPPLTITRTS